MDLKKLSSRLEDKNASPTQPVSARKFSSMDEWKLLNSRKISVPASLQPIKLHNQSEEINESSRITLSEHLRHSTSAVDQLQQQVKTLAILVIEKDKIIQNKNAEIRRRQSDLKKLSSVLESKINEPKWAAKSLEKEISAAKTMLEQQENTIKSLKLTVEGTKQGIESEKMTNKSLLSQMDLKDQEIKQGNEILEKMSIKYTDLVEQNRLSHHEITAKLKNATDKLKRNEFQMNSHQTAFKQQLHDLKQSLDSITLENDEFKTNTESLMKAKLRLEKKLEQMQLEKKKTYDISISDQKLALESSNKIKSLLDKARSMLNEAQSKIEESSKKNEILSLKLEASDAQMNSLNITFEKKHRHHAAKTDAEIQKMKADFQSKYDQVVSKSKTSLMDLTSSFKMQIDERDSLCASLQEQMNILQTRSVKELNNLVSFQTQIRQCKVEYTALQDMVSGQAEGFQVSLQRAIEAAGVLLQQKDSLEEYTQNLKNECNQLKSEMALQNERHSKHIIMLEVEVRHQQAGADELRKSIGTLELKLEESQCQQSTIITQLRNQCSKLALENQNAERYYLQEIKKLQELQKIDAVLAENSSEIREDIDIPALKADFGAQLIKWQSRTSLLQNQLQAQTLRIQQFEKQSTSSIDHEQKPGLVNSFNLIQKELSAQKAVMNIKCLISAAESTDATFLLEFSQKKEKNLYERIHLLNYHVSACESHMSICEPGATSKHHQNRMMNLKTLDQQIKDSEIERDLFLKSSTNNKSRLQILLQQTEAKLKVVQDQTKREMPEIF